MRKAETAVTAAVGEVIRAKPAARKAVRKVRKATAAVIAAATEGNENGDGSRLE